MVVAVCQQHDLKRQFVSRADLVLSVVLLVNSRTVLEVRRRAHLLDRARSRCCSMSRSLLGQFLDVASFDLIEDHPGDRLIDVGLVELSQLSKSHTEDSLDRRVFNEAVFRLDFFLIDVRSQYTRVDYLGRNH